jgi:tRNA 2-selenouridine synthase SelU
MIQDISKYDLIIDARSERECQEDHITGTVNLSVVTNEQYAEVGIQHKYDTNQIQDALDDVALELTVNQIGEFVYRLVCLDLSTVAMTIVTHRAGHNR